MGAQIFNFVISHFSKKILQKSNFLGRETTLWKGVSSHLPVHLKPILRSNGSLGEVLEHKNEMLFVLDNFTLFLQNFYCFRILRGYRRYIQTGR